MVCGGGNTRLTILQQLFREGDSRFEQVELTFKAWHGDAEAIAGHLGENEQRGEMCFWDRAAGIMDVKAALEAQGGAPLSLRQLEAELKRLDADPAARRWVEDELRRPVEPAEVARSASSPEMGAEIYLASVLVADETTTMERAYLDELARQLKLAPELKADLEARARAG